MNMTPVASSHVESVGYDPETKVLRVSFLNHTTYDYRDVPEAIYTQLIEANSVGRFLAQHVKPFFNAERTL